MKADLCVHACVCAVCAVCMKTQVTTMILIKQGGVRSELVTGKQSYTYM